MKSIVEDMIAVHRDGQAIIIPEALLEIGDFPLLTVDDVNEEISRLDRMRLKAQENQSLRDENARIKAALEELQKLHLDVKARELAVSPNDNPEERARKLREYQRSRIRAKAFENHPEEH